MKIIFRENFCSRFPRKGLNKPNESPELLIYLEFIDREIKRRSSEEEEFSVQVSIVNKVIFFLDFLLLFKHF